MRLIDADKLKRAFIGNRYGTKAIEYVIDDAPTVKAIPIEWVKKYANKLIELENHNYFAYRGLGDTGESILNMLEVWEKENEID